MDNPVCVDFRNVRGLAPSGISKFQLCHVCCNSEFLYTVVDNPCVLWEHLPRGQIPRKMDWVCIDGDQTGANSLDRDWCVYSLLGAVFHPQHRDVLLQEKLQL